MLATLARRTLRRPRLVLAVTLVLLGVAGVVGAGAFGSLRTGGFEAPGSDTVRARAVLAAHFGGEPDLVLLVRTPGAVDSPAGAAAGRAVAAKLAAEPGVDGVTSYWESRAAGLRSRDGRDGLVLAHVTGDEATAAARTADLVAAMRGPGPAGGQVRVGGGAAVGDEIGGQVAADLARAESVAVPVTLLLLVLAFGSVVAALLPLAVSLLAIVGTFAVLAVLARVTDVSVFALNLTTALGLGLAIDYALLLVGRYREELHGGAAPADAVVAAVATAGRTIVFSGVAVAVALAAMLVFPLYFLRSFAYAGIAVVAIAVLAAVVVLPALLAVLGPRVDAGRIPLLRRGPAAADSAFWRRVATTVMRRPVLTGLPVVVLLLALGAPALQIRFGTPDDRALPPSAQTRQVGDRLRTGFADEEAGALQVLVTGSTPAALVPYSRQLSALPDVARVRTVSGTYVSGRPVAPGGPATARLAAGRTVLLEAVPAVDPQSPAAERLVRRVRSLPPPAQAGVVVGGASASLVDQKSAIRDRLPLALGLVAATTLVVLFLFTGSVLLPVKALVLNVLSLSAVFGAMVWIFQQGHLAGVLGFTPGPINTAMPVLLFCIAFGLSMDYEVFLLSRITELHAAGADTETAVTVGLARTGRIVSTAAALLAVTFFAFGTSTVSFIKLFGIGTGIAILLDATLVRGVLVPAIMRLAGGANWWAPAGLRRLHRRFGLAESAGGPRRPVRPAAEPSS